MGVGLCALGLLGIGLLQGGVLGLLGVALGLGWALVAAWIGCTRTRRQPAWLVAGGGAGLLLAIGWLSIGALVPGLLAAGLAMAVLFTGSQRSLFHAPLPAGLELPAPLSLRTNLAVTADEGLRWLWGVTAKIQPPPPPAQVARDLWNAVERYRDEGLLADPRRAHPLPPALEKARLSREHVAGFGGFEHLRYESEFVARDPEVRDSWQAVVPNRTAHVYLWRHGDRPRPTLICLHGYGMGRLRLDLRQWDLATWHRELGLDIALPVLPLHGPRAPGLRSGQGFLDGHPLATNAAFGQAIWELRQLVGWLRQQGVPAVGVHGLSLGGYTAALFGSLEPGLACGIPSIPVVALAELLADDWTARERRERATQGFDVELLRRAWTSHSPLAHRPQVARQARLIVAARADRICPPEQAVKLWEHWDRPAIHWTPGSHLVALGRATTRRRIAEHLRATLLAAAAAPTLSRFQLRQVGGEGAQPPAS